MELYTLNRQFLEQDVIDTFRSAIWTERYYGDSEIELKVDPTAEMYKKLPKGILVGMKGTDEIMMIETREYEDGYLKLTGISLTQWLNNRFIRTSALHEDRYWTIDNRTIGDILHTIVYYMTISGGYMDGSSSIGISNPSQLIIPGLQLGDYVRDGDIMTVGVPFGPLYDALKELATTYEVGIQIYLESATEAGYTLRFRNYRGLDRTSDQMVNPLVRFSPQMNSLTDIKELESIAAFKTQVWVFAPGNPDGLATTPGHDGLYSIDSQFRGFDLRAEMVFAEDITTDQVGGDANVLLSLLNTRARDALSNADVVNVIDGEVVPGVQHQYGRDYYLGDLVEIQGVSGAIQKARVTEYIRSQDSTGKHEYPTLTFTD